ncbi:TMEM165/GDT1 family protein [Cyanobium sp. ATX 6A2]|uniref:TMEM165/GDT1 family protein n=1 Tax=Cyanobium sp. ATX 6A2 TaxID=2823700 RepID=UPI0020CB7C67|nr:TMEM165/GDT1 family protein [Cyanobium sp. ATX 6A2]MCP9887376.1 TMEM165/GDT1 family protein [Cyanobium sp. ATX 6A2]
MNSEESGELPAEGTGAEPGGAHTSSEGRKAGTATPASGAFLGALVTTFTTVFLAELGDKTQLAALLLSAQSGQPLVVFIGASLALISSSLVGVLLGRWLARLLPAHELERLAGLLMVGLSLWLGRQAVVQLNTPPTGLPLG